MSGVACEFSWTELRRVLKMGGGCNVNRWNEYMQLLSLNTRDHNVMMEIRTGLAALFMR